MMTPGHNQIPSEECYQKFANTVRNFLHQNKNNGKIIKRTKQSKFILIFCRETNRCSLHTWTQSNGLFDCEV